MVATNALGASVCALNYSIDENGVNEIMQHPDKIMIVDHNEDNRNLLLFMLAEHWL